MQDCLSTLRRLTYVCFLVVPVAFGQEALRDERLATAGKLWIAADYFHPWIAQRDIDWDAALIAAIPKIKAAGSVAEYAAAVQAMLDVLQDPATRVIRQPASSVGSNDPPLSHRKTETGILIIHLGNQAELMDFMTAREMMMGAARELADAKGIVFDLRTSKAVTEERELLPFLFTSTGLNRLASEPVREPHQRARMHSGYAFGSGSGGYYSGFHTSGGNTIPGRPGMDGKSVVFLVNENSEIPPVAVALQTAGKAAIVSEGRMREDSLVSTVEIPLVEGVTARLRTAELLYEDGSTGVEPDAEVQGDAMATAIKLASGPIAKRTARKPVAWTQRPFREYTESDGRYPAGEQRILAAIRIWGAFNYFFAYRDLMGGDWGAVLTASFPRFEQAKDELEYSLAVAEMVKQVHDTHAYIQSTVLREYLGASPAPVRVRIIEGKPIVTEVLDKSTEARVGDIVLSVDGEDAAARIRRLSKYIAASTPQSLNNVVAGVLLSGPNDSVASVIVADGNSTRELRMKRSREFYGSLRNQRTGDIIKLLPNNIGYADLDRLPQPMVDEMFDKFKDAKAIIFDMRGYPHGTAWSIAPRLTEKTRVPAALFRRPLALAPEIFMEGKSASYASTFFRQPIPATDKPRFKGRTVMLIDERTISQAEHTGLFFEAANGTKFIGSPTTGANGDVTTFSIPGGIRIGMSGHDVRHADGRQLQRLGLQPDIEVWPTIAGIREEKDEVLEKAIEYLQN